MSSAHRSTNFISPPYNSQTDGCSYRGYFFQSAFLTFLLTSLYCKNCCAVRSAHGHLLFLLLQCKNLCAVAPFTDTSSSLYQCKNLCAVRSVHGHLLLFTLSMQKLRGRAPHTDTLFTHMQNELVPHSAYGHFTLCLVPKDYTHGSFSIFIVHYIHFGTFRTSRRCSYFCHFLCILVFCKTNVSLQF